MADNLVIGKFPKPLPEKREGIDLAWAREHIAGFAKMETMARQVKASEAEYKKLLEKK